MENSFIRKVLGLLKQSPEKERPQDLKQHTEKSYLENFFALLQQIKYVPDHIVDIGSNHGNWTKTALKYFPNARYTMLEPQQWLESHVKDLLESNSKIKFYPFGAGKEMGSFKFTIMDRDDSSTFIVDEENAKKLGLKQIDVDIVTLNEFIPRENLPIPDLIKIDAEGLDLDVLTGASNYLGKVEIIMVEAAIVSTYVKNDISTVMEFMFQHGYKLFDITDLNRPFNPPVLWLAELVFVRKNGIIDSQQLVNIVL